MNWKFWKRSKSKIVKTIDQVIKSDVFPCKSDRCLVRVSCTKACEKIIMDDKQLMETFLKYNACPDCGSESFKEGPHGGLSINVKCNGCGHYFNFGLPLFINRIHIGPSGEFQESW